MPTELIIRTPVARLVAVLAFALFAALTSLVVAVQMPWLGLHLQADPEHGGLRVMASQGPAIGVPVGAVLLSVADSNGGARISLNAEDLREEPDVVNDYVEMDAFFARQGQLASVLAADRVRVQWQMPGDEVHEAEIVPTLRPLAALPGMFWFQMLVSLAGCLIAGWVWALRPDDWGARMFALTGLAFPVFALSAAVYSSRELAMDAGWFTALSAVNHGGAVLFGTALVGIFLCYPKRLLGPAWLLPLFGFYGLWWLAETLRLLPDLDWGHRYTVMSQMLTALVLGIVQWRLSRSEPINRAALRWLMLSLLLGSGLFIVSTVATVSLGWLPPLPQGYAFGFFLFIYLGIGLGLGRYRLFELDTWAYRLLLWLGGALLVLGLDALLVLALNWSAALALPVALWVAGLIYFPLRQWLWQRLSSRPRRTLQELMTEVVEIAMQTSQTERDRFWQALLERLFKPLELRPSLDVANTATAVLTEQGLELRIAPRAGLTGLRLRYPGQGARLFSPADADFITALIQLLEQAEASRTAQERGAAEERRRIARDMHDDVGARLLMLVHHAPTEPMAELARAAIQDLRTALNALDGQPQPIGEALADWRAEAGSRCEAANVALHWQADVQDLERLVSPHWKSILERALRECLSNALKHADTDRIEVRIAEQDGEIQIEVLDHGQGTATETWREGRGLRGMRQRLAEYQGRLAIAAMPQGGSQVTITLPMPR